MKIRNLVELFTILPEDEKIIVDVLRQPSTVPRGGIKKGVLLGFWYGNKLDDRDHFLTHGTNKQVFYKIYQTPEQIDDKPIKKLLKEAIKLDGTFKKKISG